MARRTVRRVVLPPSRRHRARAGRHRAVPGVQPRPLRAGAGLDRRRLEDTWSPQSSHARASLALPGVHRRAALATALALLVFFRRTGCASSGRSCAALRASGKGGSCAHDPDERLAWLIVIATIPVGITGLALEHAFRMLFAKPVAASIFLFVNGLILLVGERLRRRARRRPRCCGPPRRNPAAVVTARGRRGGRAPPTAGSRRLSCREAGVIGLSRSLALLAGISRSGITMVGGLLARTRPRGRGPLRVPAGDAGHLRRRRPEVPSLFGPAGDHIHGPVAVGFVVTGVTAYLSVRFLVALVRDPHAHADGVVLRAGRRGEHRPLRLSVLARR